MAVKSIFRRYETPVVMTIEATQPLHCAGVLPKS
jgi:hypothetical protein